jgi:hypothetical protein
MLSFPPQKVRVIEEADRLFVFGDQAASPSCCGANQLSARTSGFWSAV